MSKLKKTLCLFLIIVVSFLNNNFRADDVYSDQTLAQELQKAPMNISLASGYTQEGQSLIFTTIYDKSGQYRGYRVNQIFRDEVPNKHLETLQDEADNVCTVSEITEQTFDYQGEKKSGFDIICMQKVGNNGSVTIDGDSLNINKNYGKTDGYLVGVQIPNYTFADVEGGEVKDNILYIIDDAGGSATIEPATNNSSEKESEGGSSSSINIFPLIGVIVFLVLIILLPYLYLRKKRKKNVDKEMMEDYPYNNYPPDEGYQYNMQQDNGAYYNQQAQNQQFYQDNNQMQYHQPQHVVNGYHQGVEANTYQEVDISNTVQQRNDPNVVFEKTEVNTEERDEVVEEVKEERNSVIQKINQMVGKE